MQISAIQAVATKIEVPLTPAPMAQPPASIAPKPISTAPNNDRRIAGAPA